MCVHVHVWCFSIAPDAVRARGCTGCDVRMAVVLQYIHTHTHTHTENSSLALNASARTRYYTDPAIQIHDVTTAKPPTDDVHRCSGDGSASTSGVARALALGLEPAPTSLPPSPAQEAASASDVVAVDGVLSRRFVVGCWGSPRSYHLSRGAKLNVLSDVWPRFKMSFQAPMFEAALHKTKPNQNRHHRHRQTHTHEHVHNARNTLQPHTPVDRHQQVAGVVANGVAQGGRKVLLHGVREHRSLSCPETEQTPHHSSNDARATVVATVVVQHNTTTQASTRKQHTYQHVVHGTEPCALEGQ